METKSVKIEFLETYHQSLLAADWDLVENAFPGTQKLAEDEWSRRLSAAFVYKETVGETLLALHKMLGQLGLGIVVWNESERLVQLANNTAARLSGFRRRNNAVTEAISDFIVKILEEPFQYLRGLANWRLTHYESGIGTGLYNSLRVLERAAAKMMTPLRSDTVESLFVSISEPDEQLCLEDLWREFTRDLEPREMLMANLKIREELSVEEASRRMNIGLTTGYIIYNRALAKIREKAAKQT